MVAFDIRTIFLLPLTVLFFSKEAFSQFGNCPPGNLKCWQIPGSIPGSWLKSGGLDDIVVPLPIPEECPPGEYWVASWDKCIPYVRSGPGGRWRSGYPDKPIGECPPGERWHPLWGRCIPDRTGVSSRMGGLDLGPQIEPEECLLGENYDPVLERCVPSIWKSGASLLCPPGETWNPLWGECTDSRWKSGLRPQPGRCPPGETWNPLWEDCTDSRWKSARTSDPCPFGQNWHPVWKRCTYIKGGPGGRWKSGYPNKPIGECPPGERWHPLWGRCIPIGG